jgi:hypothetical protein
MFSKSDYKWAFKPDDWFLDIVLSNRDIRNRIFIVKNYNFTNINGIIYDIYNLVKDERTKRENQSPSFIAKKNYLLKNKNNGKIQLTLEDEYTIKELIERYKSYELISWMHLGKNNKIFKYCVVQKQEILTKLYQLLDIIIRKVVGSKVISPVKPEFEEAINFVWTQIINYLTKIDTSKVMFSIFVRISQQAAINYNKKYILPQKYNEIRISDLMLNNNDNDDMDDDIFINTVSNNNNVINNYDVENDILDKLDNTNLAEEEVLYYNQQNSDVDNIIDNIENEDKNNVLQQNVLAHSYNILSGKVKHICYDKIFAEFFADLINSNISEKLVTKYTPIILDVMNSSMSNNDSRTNNENNEYVYKLFRDWIKDKINNKLIKFNINDKEELNKIINRENKILNYIKTNKSSILVELVKYKKECNIFK